MSAMSCTSRITLGALPSLNFMYGRSTTHAIPVGTSYVSFQESGTLP